MKKNLKKIIAGFVVIGTFAAYVISQTNNSGNPTATLADNSSSQNVNPIAQNTTPQNATDTVTLIVPKPVVKPVTKPALKPVGAFTDGTYTGSVVDAYYGNIQVQTVITNGKISDVIFLQHPNDRGTSIRINNMAMPILKSETIAAQSANVDAVSGASETSRAFVESLQSTLNQAKA